MPPAVPEKSAAAKALSQAPPVEAAAAPGPSREFSPDSLAQFFRPEAEILYAKLSGDTLWMVSTADFVYYPFGRCPDLACAKKRYAPLLLTPPSTIGSGPNSFVSFSGKYNRSEVALIQGEDEGKDQVQVAAGILRDADVKLANGVAVDELLARFLPRFFRKPLDVKTQAAVKVVRLDSGVDRIRHYYTFSGGALQRVEFKTEVAENLGFKL